MVFAGVANAIEAVSCKFRIICGKKLGPTPVAHSLGLDGDRRRPVTSVVGCVVREPSRFVRNFISRPRCYVATPVGPFGLGTPAKDEEVVSWVRPVRGGTPDHCRMALPVFLARRVVEGLEAFVAGRAVGGRIDKYEDDGVLYYRSYSKHPSRDQSVAHIFLSRINDRHPSFATLKPHQTHHHCLFWQRWRWQILSRCAARAHTVHLVLRCEDRYSRYRSHRPINPAHARAGRQRCPSKQ